MRFGERVAVASRSRPTVCRKSASGIASSPLIISSSVPVEDVTGAERLGTDAPASRELVQVIGYPSATDQPVTCQDPIRQPMAGQLEFDCDGYTNGTSGGPFLSEVDQATGQGLVIGVIGGFQQGGDAPQVSYSAVLGANAAALYSEAVADAGGGTSAGGDG